MLAAGAVLVAKSHTGRREACAPCSTEPVSPAKALDSALAEHRPVWLLVHSTMCVPCKEMSRVSAELAPEFDGRVEFVSAIVDDPSAQQLLETYRIELIPTSFLIDGSGEVAEKFVGAVSADEMRAKLRKLTEGRR